MLKNFFRKTWPSLIIVLVWAVMTGLSKLEIDISWVKDINVWANAFVLELFLFQLMSAITIKIKNQYCQSLISLIVSLFVGETIKYNFNILDFSFINLLGVISLSLFVVVITYHAFIFGINKGIKEVDKQEHALRLEIKNMPDKDIDKFLIELDKSIDFIKNNPFASSMIKSSDLEELESFKKEIKEMRNEKEINTKEV